MKIINIIKKICICSAIVLLAAGIAYAQQKAIDAPFKVGDKTVQLSQFKGQKRILWLFSTWCPSCAVGLQELSKKQPKLLKNDVQVIALLNYNNGGYPGLSGTIDTFIKKYLKNPALLKAKNWTFGEATKELEQQYNPHTNPDIFLLIDGQGNIVRKANSLGAHMEEVMDFASDSATN